MLPLPLVLILFIAVQTAHTASQPQLTYYAAANQFSDSSNPNGTWSYGYTTKLGGSFTRYTISGTSDVGDGWYGYTLGGTPLLVTQSISNLLTLHPGPKDEQSVARWTAPFGGTFNFLGFFYGLDPADGSSVAVLKNHVAMYSDTVSGNGDEKDFNLSFALRQGDKIDFVVATIPGHTVGGVYAGIGVAIAPQLFKFTPVQYLGVPDAIVYGINNLGDIVGRYKTADGAKHGFMLHNGVFTTIDYPGAADSFLLSINDWGQVLGYTGELKFFLWSNGKFTDLAYPGAVNSQFDDVNDLGYMVGIYSMDGSTYLGFVRGPDGSYFSFGPPNSLTGSIFPSGINLLGQIALTYQDEAGIYHGFLRNPNGKFIPVDFPGAADGTSPNTINVWSAIVGVYWGLGGPAYNQSFLSVGSDFVPVWVPGQKRTYLSKINDLGQVVGYYRGYDDNLYHGFIGTPILPLKP